MSAAGGAAFHVGMKSCEDFQEVFRVTRQYV